MTSDVIQNIPEPELNPGTVYSDKRRSAQELELRRDRVIQLWALHYKQTEIATILRKEYPLIDQAKVSRDIKEIVKRWRERAIKTLSDFIIRELIELEEMEHDLCLQYVRTHNPRLIELRLAIKERRAKLLGLDKIQPLQLELNAHVDGEVGIEHGIDADTAETIFDILERAGALPAESLSAEIKQIHHPPTLAEATGLSTT